MTFSEVFSTTGGGADLTNGAKRCFCGKIEGSETPFCKGVFVGEIMREWIKPPRSPALTRQRIQIRTETNEKCPFSAFGRPESYFL